MGITFHFTVDCDWIPNSGKSLPLIFDLIEKFNIEPTFFLTGNFAKENRALVDEIRSRNYEIGCHGLAHGLDPSENFGENVSFEKQQEILKRATEIIYETSGINPIIFRAPKLKISNDTFKLLNDLKYRIDSSLPVKRFDFGFGTINSLKYLFSPNSTFFVDNCILEIPPSSLILPFNMRLIRVFGLNFAEKFFNFLKLSTNIIVFYSHPAEFLSFSELKYPRCEKYFYKNCGPQNYILLETFLRKIFNSNIQFKKMCSHLNG